jgi:hypothetical protein
VSNILLVYRLLFLSSPRIQNVLFFLTNQNPTSPPSTFSHFSFLPSLAFDDDAKPPSLMEPRVKNLILTETPGARRRDGQAAHNTKRNTTQPSSITTTPVDPQLDSHLTSRVQSLNNDKHLQSLAEEATKRQNNSAPIAEVLNKNSPKLRPAPVDQDHDNARPKKSRRLDADTMRTLPKLPTHAREKRNHLPPMLAPLHNPPADAQIIPSMSSDRFRHVLPETFAQAISESQNNEAGAQVQAEDFLLNDDEHPEDEVDTPRPGKKGKRSRWTPEETQCLIEGVAKFGIGHWKEILMHPEFKFKEGRNAMDLKDRFRTCYPEEYRKSGAQTNRNEVLVDESGKRRGRGSRTTHELAKMGLNTQMGFRKSERRQRNAFTEEEDEALLRGFQKYPAQWKKIQLDPELGLTHRTRTDLRDRFRNRYPQRFKEAGYKHKAKQSASEVPARPSENISISLEAVSISKEHNEPLSLHHQSPSMPQFSSKVRNLAPKYAPSAEESELAALLLGHNHASSRDQNLAGPNPDSNFSLSVLSGGIPSSYDTNFAQALANTGEDEAAQAQLSRDIFEWNVRHQDDETNYDRTNGEAATSVEQYAIRALLERASSSMEQGPNTLPLSRILNATSTEESTVTADIV